MAWLIIIALCVLPLLWIAADFRNLSLTPQEEEVRRKRISAAASEEDIQDSKAFWAEVKQCQREKEEARIKKELAIIEQEKEAERLKRIQEAQHGI